MIGKKRKEDKYTYYHLLFSYFIITVVVDM